MTEISIEVQCPNCNHRNWVPAPLYRDKTQMFPGTISDMKFKNKVLANCKNYGAEQAEANNPTPEEELVEAILSLLDREIESVIGEEKEIIYEELDTGIGIDKLEYDIEENHITRGYNNAKAEIRLAWKERKG